MLSYYPYLWPDFIPCENWPFSYQQFIWEAVDRVKGIYFRALSQVLCTLHVYRSKIVKEKQKWPCPTRQGKDNDSRHKAKVMIHSGIQKDVFLENSRFIVAWHAISKIVTQDVCVGKTIRNNLNCYYCTGWRDDTKQAQKLPYCVILIFLNWFKTLI